MTAVTIGLALVLATVGTIGWFFGRRSVVVPTPRRWGERLRREIEAAGGVGAWKRNNARDVLPVSPGFAQQHPLDGSLLTQRGVWWVIVLKDEDDGRTRRLTLSLSAPEAVRPFATVLILVRVPRNVIAVERPQTWPADLRAELTSWINTSVIERGETIWWPTQSSERDSSDAG